MSSFLDKLSLRMPTGQPVGNVQEVVGDGRLQLRREGRDGSRDISLSPPLIFIYMIVSK